MVQNNIKKAAVIGYPVKHSLSPRLHGFWLKKYNIAGEYFAIEVRPEELSDFIKNMAANGFCGVNLTIPHKEAVIPMLDEVDNWTEVIGATNTIIVKDNGKLFGTNTDSYGFIANVRPHFSSNPFKKKAVILGAGGAARAVCFALLSSKYFKEITITNRTIERSERLKNVFLHQERLLSKEDCPNIKVSDWNDREKILDNADLLVNTTSLGMAGKESLEIDLSLLPKTALVTDIVYSPLITPLLAQAQARGNPTVDGLGMLLHQAVPAFEAWFAKELNGRKPEVTQELRDFVLGK